MVYEVAIDGQKTERESRTEAIGDAMKAAHLGHFAVAIERNDNGKQVIWPTEHAGRTGFTIVELLVTITIIGILAGLATIAISFAQTKAREWKTKTLITKIDMVIQSRWSHYRERRIPLDSASMTEIAKRVYGIPLGEPIPYDTRKNIMLYARRDLMRLELPDRWSDVDANRPELIWPLSFSTARMNRIRKTYDNAVAKAGQEKVNLNAAAECLYLIVMEGEDVELFRYKDHNDTDGDGLEEFIDGWGRPIRWLRWPAGLPISQDGTAFPGDTDPFDPEQISGDYRVDPLVYSAGPDGLYDINIGKYSSGETWKYELDFQGRLLTCAKDGQGELIGTPLDSDGMNGQPQNNSLDHYDNITSVPAARR